MDCKKNLFQREGRSPACSTTAPPFSIDLIIARKRSDPVVNPVNDRFFFVKNNKDSFMVATGTMSQTVFPAALGSWRYIRYLR